MKIGKMTAQNKEIQFLEEMGHEIDRRYSTLTGEAIPESTIQAIAKLRVKLLEVEDSMYEVNRALVQARCNHTFVKMTDTMTVHGKVVPPSSMCTKCYFIGAEQKQ